MRCDICWADRVFVRLEGNYPWLHVEISAEFLPHAMYIASKDQVWVCCRLPRCLAAFAPVPLQRKTAEHDRLRRALGTGTSCLTGRVEKISEHSDTTLLDFGSPRILRMIAEV